MTKVRKHRLSVSFPERWLRGKNSRRTVTRLCCSAVRTMWETRGRSATSTWMSSHRCARSPFLLSCVPAVMWTPSPTDAATATAPAPCSTVQYSRTCVISNRGHRCVERLTLDAPVKLQSPSVTDSRKLEQSYETETASSSIPTPHSSMLRGVEGNGLCLCGHASSSARSLRATARVIFACSLDCLGAPRSGRLRAGVAKLHLACLLVGMPPENARIVF